MIFNYGYGCCVFAHNIYGSQPVVPNGMPNTSKPLSPKSFINPQCPPSVVPAEAVAVLEDDTNEASKHLSPAKVGLGKEPNSSTRVTKESEDLDVFCGN